MDRTIPHDIQAERNTLGACLLERDAILIARSCVSVCDFYLEKHAWIYEAMLECVEQRIPPDIVTVSSALRRKGRLEQIGGYSFLGELVAETPVAVHVSYYADIVAKAAAHRRLIELGGEISAAAYNEQVDLRRLYEEIGHRLHLVRQASPARQDWIPHAVDGNKLWSADFDPVQYVVDRILPCGTFLLAGKPKTKKSWLMANIAYAVASGGRALGHFAAVKGDVLYIDLEMGKRRIQRRLKTLFPDDIPPPRGVIFVDTWPRIWSGFEDQLHDYLEANPFTRLVIVDTLVAIRPPRPRDMEPYEHEKSFTQTLSNFCQGRQIALVLVHHARKDDGLDMIDAPSGTTGLTGGFDNIGVLQPGEEPGTGVLGLRGRDIEQEEPLSLKWDQRLAQWNVVDDDARLTRQRQAVIKLLRQRPGLKWKDIAIMLNRPEEGTRRLLSEMTKDGQIYNAQGLYFADDPEMTSAA